MADTPDFDSMTPEQIMEWMESLAKRQGATEGFTTAADMQVQDIAADDERLKDKKDYVPYGWKEEDWKVHLAKEEEQKKAKAAAAPPPVAKPVPPKPVAPPAPPVQQVAPPPPPPAPVAAAPAADATPDFDKMSPEEIMKWMESLAKRQGATEGFTTAADMQVQDIAADDERLKDKKDYVPYGWKEEDWKVHLAKEEEQKKAKAAAQAAAPTPPPPPKPVAPPAPPVQQFTPAPPPPPAPSSLDDFFSSLTANELPELADEDDETVPTAISDNPMDWLAGLAGETDESLGSFQTPEFDDPLKALESLAAGGDDLSDMNWLAELAGNTADSTDALANLSRLAAPEDPLEALSRLGGDSMPPATGPQPGADTIEWLESLARDQGADPSELTTRANLNVPPPSNFMPDGPGYDPYSFEAGGDFAAEAPVPVAEPDFSLFADDDDDLDMDNAEDWLDALAVNAGDTTPTKATPPVAETAVVDDVMARLNQAKEVTPEEIEGMFDALFKKAETFAHLDQQAREAPVMPIEEDVADSPITAEIPDWLQEQMVVAPPDVSEADAQSAADIAALLDAPEPAVMPDWLQAPDDAPMPDFGAEQALDEQALATDGLPDWLQTEEEETADISAIFVDDEPALPDPVKPVLELDTNDSLVLALKQEAENEEELIAWYEQQLQKTGGEVTPAAIEELLQQTPLPVQTVAGAAALQAADLPLETELQPGEPENVPDWLLGEAAATVTVAGDEGMPDWLIDATNEAEAVSVDTDMPDWLREQVGDTDHDDVDVPDWLQSAGTEVNVEEIPDWLLQTMTDEQNAVSVDMDAELDLEPEVMTMPAVVAPPPPPTRAISPAPVAPVLANINVQQTLQAARSKVTSQDIDGALLDYEAIVRANTDLDVVVNDLNKLVEDTTFKKNPAVYRVLGDSLMRRGNLQQALETYRRALNLL